MLRARTLYGSACLLAPQSAVSVCTVQAAVRGLPRRGGVVAAPFATQATAAQPNQQQKQKSKQQQAQQLKQQQAAALAAQKLTTAAQKKAAKPQPQPKQQAKAKAAPKQPTPPQAQTPRATRRSQSAPPPAPAAAPRTSTARALTPAPAPTPQKQGRAAKAKARKNAPATDDLLPSSTASTAAAGIAKSPPPQARPLPKQKQKSKVSAVSAAAGSPGSRTRVRSPLVYENDPEARHRLMHELCSTLLPSQARALSLLLYLCKAINPSGVALIDLMRPNLVRPQGRHVGNKNKASAPRNASPLDPLAKRPPLVDVALLSRITPPHKQHTPDASLPQSHPSSSLSSSSARGNNTLNDEWLQVGSGPGPRPQAHRMHPEKRLELQSMYEKVEAHAAADVQTHLAKVKAEERRVQTQAAQLRPRATAPITPTREHWLRLSDDAVQRHAAGPEGEDDASGLMLLRSTRIDRQLFRGARQLILAKEKDEILTANALGTTLPTPKASRQSTFLIEASRILCSHAETFMPRLMQHYANLNTREFEAVRQTYPEAETNNFLAFKVHWPEEEASEGALVEPPPPPTPLPAFGSKWTGAQPAAVPPQPTPKLLTDGTSPASLHPLTTTPVVTQAARVIALPRTVYIDEWRTSFGSRGSFDAMTPLDYAAPAVSLSNDIHSAAARSWLEPLCSEETVSRKLLVRHLHPEISVAELVHAFSVFGTVEAGEIHREQLAEEMEHHHPHVLDTHGKSGGKPTARDAKRRVEGEKEKSKSSVYAFLYFSDAAAVALATEPASRLFGVHVKGFTVFPQAACEKTSITITLQRQTIHDMFHRAFPRAHAHSAALDLTPNPKLNPAETLAAVGASSVLAAPGLGLGLGLGVNSLSGTPVLFRSALQEFSWSQLQSDILSALSAVGLGAEAQQLQFSSRHQLLDHGLQVDCRSHHLAERVFRVLAGHTIAGHAVTLSWTPSRVYKFDSRQNGERTDRRNHEWTMEANREKREREKATEARLQLIMQATLPRITDASSTSTGSSERP